MFTYNMQLDFSSFSVDDDDYCGYEYSLVGQLSEVRIVYLNRFVQEVSCFKVHTSLNFVQAYHCTEIFTCRLLVTLWALYPAILRVLLS